MRKRRRSGRSAAGLFRCARCGLPVMLAQILVQRRAAGFMQQILEHHVLAPALGEARSVFLAQRGDARIAMLLVNAPTLVAMAAVEAPSGLSHASLLQRCCNAMFHY